MNRVLRSILASVSMVILAVGVITIVTSQHQVELPSPRVVVAAAATAPGAQPGCSSYQAPVNGQSVDHCWEGHPENAQGYVLDGTPQQDDPHCGTPVGTNGPEPGQDECLATRHGGYVTDGDPQLSDNKCVGSAYGQAACVTARRHLPFSCVVTIVNHEDPGWDPTRWNTGGSGAYGLYQALPGRKMAVAGADWATSGATQTRWLLDHYVGEYGGVCAAANHDIRYGTY